MNAEQWAKAYVEAVRKTFSQQPRSAAQAMYPNLRNADQHRQAEREREKIERARPKARW